MREKRSKFPVIKILTSNFIVLKVLQPTFCKTRASQAFPEGWGEGGIPFQPEIFPKRTGFKHGLKSHAPNYFFAGIPQAIFHSHA